MPLSSPWCCHRAPPRGATYPSTLYLSCAHIQIRNPGRTSPLPPPSHTHMRAHACNSASFCPYAPANLSFQGRSFSIKSPLNCHMNCIIWQICGRRVFGFCKLSGLGAVMLAGFPLRVAAVGEAGPAGGALLGLAWPAARLCLRTPRLCVIKFDEIWPAYLIKAK